MHKKLLEKFSRVEKKAKATRLRRMLYSPVNYIYAIFFRTMNYKFFKKPVLKETRLFFGKEFYVELPAGTDIFITGGKSDDSEQRLTKFIIKNLEEGNSFIDVGAHFGFYTCLAAECVGTKGIVYSFEGSGNNFKILQLNVNGEANIHCFNKIVSDREGMATMYEFPAIYSEFNTLYPGQYENQAWYSSVKFLECRCASVTLNSFFDEHEIQPRIIKIDTEGAEYDVVKGFDRYLSKFNSGFIVLEYLCTLRKNVNHQKAAHFLNSFGFKSFLINEDGDLEPCTDIEEYLARNNLESDNIVFSK